MSINCSGDDAFSRRVVCFDKVWWLGKIEFLYCDAEGYSCFPIVEQSLNSALATDATVYFRILHSVWIGPLAGGGRFGDFSGSVGSELR